MVLLWETLRPICLYLSFPFSFLMLCPGWATPVSRPVSGWAVRTEECWVDHYRAHHIHILDLVGTSQTPYLFFHPEYTLGERPSLLTKVSHSTPRKQSCFERLGFRPCHMSVSVCWCHFSGDVTSVFEARSLTLTWDISKLAWQWP